jgi:hypothetical protein
MKEYRKFEINKKIKVEKMSKNRNSPSPPRQGQNYMGAQGNGESPGKGGGLFGS